MPDLTGAIALVTGASRGIGAAIVADLAAAGATVVAASRSGGGGGIPLVMDVADEASVQAGFAEVAQRFGRLDILVANAGIGRYDALAEASLEDFEAVMATNARGAFLCCREAMRSMQPRRSGSIITIASVVGVKGYPRQAAYTASKHAVMGLTKSLAVEAQEHGIRVSAVLPGGVDTDMVAQARPDLDRTILIRPEDVAYSVRFLLTLPESCAIDQIAIRRRGAEPF